MKVGHAEATRELCVCVFAFWGWNISDSVRFLFFVTPQRAVSGRDLGRQGVAPAPHFQLCERHAGPCCADSGCRVCGAGRGVMRVWCRGFN